MIAKFRPVYDLRKLGPLARVYDPAAWSDAWVCIYKGYLFCPTISPLDDLDKCYRLRHSRPLIEIFPHY